MKFADTQKEKDQKRLQQMQANLWNLAGVNMGPQYLAVSTTSLLGVTCVCVLACMRAFKIGNYHAKCVLLVFSATFYGPLSLLYF